MVVYICHNSQGLIEHHREIVEYFKKKGVSAIFLFRRNLLRRMISVLANSYDKDAKLLNGTHKSHVHSPLEVSLSLSMSHDHACLHTFFFYYLQAQILAKYKPKINATLMIKELNKANETMARALEYFKSTRHTVVYYEDVINNRSVRNAFLSIFVKFRLIASSFALELVITF